MNIGMLWQINKKLSIEENILAAKEYHDEKYKPAKASACEVNKSVLDKRTEIHNIAVIPVRYIQPCLLWIGEK